MSGITRRSSRAARRLTVLGTALAALAVGLGTPSRADLRPPASALGAPKAPAAAPHMVTVTCGNPTPPVYHVDALAQLRRWNYASPLDGSSGWTERLIGTGWGGLNVESGGSGVLFVIDSSGNLRWYKDNNFNGSGGASWDPASGSIIGTGWGGFITVTSGGQGVIYAADSAGNLRWYRYVGTNGSASWASGSGTTIGTGWNSLAAIVAGGSGVIYAVTSTGHMLWYRALDPLNPSGSWANGGSGKPIGSGWSVFSQIGSVGGGVIFARDTAGGMWWYRDTDPLGGSFSWANNGTGISEGTGWNNSQVAGDITGCVAT